MQNKTHAKVTIEDGELVAQLLKPESEPVNDVVLTAIFPLGPQLINIAYYGMSRDLAQTLATTDNGRLRTLEAIAKSTVGIAQENEQWYVLAFKPSGRAIRQNNRMTKELNKAIEQAGGWLNSIILYNDSGEWILDVALSDETKGQQAIEGCLSKWSIREYVLRVKDDGVNF